MSCRARIGTGSWIYIEELAGFLVPDGSIHSGLVRADDVGSAIRGDRLDVFIGDEAHLALVESVFCPSNGWVTAHAVSER